MKIKQDTREIQTRKSGDSGSLMTLMSYQKKKKKNPKTAYLWLLGIDIILLYNLNLSSLIFFSYLYSIAS